MLSLSAGYMVPKLRLDTNVATLLCVCVGGAGVIDM